jgi:hypothetical protein
MKAQVMFDGNIKLIPEDATEQIYLISKIEIPAVIQNDAIPTDKLSDGLVLQFIPELA